MALYHRDVYLPAPARSLSFAVMLRYSRHARDAAASDRYGSLPLPVALDTRHADLVEAEVVNGQVVKALYRMPLDARRDLCIVVHPADGFVRTVWANLRSDAHRTLDATRYATA